MKRREKMKAQSATLPASFRDAVSVLKGRKPSIIVEPEANLPILLPVSAQIAAESEKQRQEDKRLKELQIGDEVPGGDIFFGTWSPKDLLGNSLGKTFNLFAQPEDISVEVFVDLCDRVRRMPKSLKKSFCESNEFYDALRSAASRVGYFIPPLEVLSILYQSRNEGCLKGTFAPKASGLDHCYWSSTRNVGDPWQVLCQNFSSGKIDQYNEDHGDRLSCRLVRAELRR